ncbi:RNB domain-containing ribonuclease [Microbacterium sp.]|uniref:RNB domain-containing ribonuclease n=1 Tax=Microbacterium sp. TaxID=51671 RepID=UPI003A86FD8B
MPARRSRLTSRDGLLADALSALRRDLAVPDGFPDAAVADAEAAARTVPVEPGPDLADLREIPFLTIDPAGATDLDQAVHLERHPGGAVLHYAIADVPAFVGPDTALDHAARERGQTLYAPDGRVPLHPELLSEDAASLLPGRDRRAFVWRFELDARAEPVTTTLTRAVVRSRAQWSYVDAQAAIDAGTAEPTLAAMAWFGRTRAEREVERGGANLNLPDIRIEPHGDGYRLELDEGVPLEEWNAQVSLLTGMAAAAIMLDGGVGILRTMPPAAPDDIADFRAQTVTLGLPWRDDVPYGVYLQSLDGGPLARVVKEHAAALFRGAGYTTFDGAPPDQTLQAAIGAPYAHTTAPLRRLVDRWTLVICEALVNGRPVPEWARTSLASIPELMERSNRQARQFDSGARDRVEAALLHPREGEIFEALVLSVRGDDADVLLHDPPVETRVAGLTAAAGATVRLRLEHASIGEGTVQCTAVAP